MFVRSTSLVSIPQGTIKRRENSLDCLRSTWFQFHKVRLKAEGTADVPSPASLFQFHKVRLKGAGHPH